MSPTQSTTARTIGTFTLAVLAAIVGNTTASAEWQTTVSDEGNYSIRMPGAGKCSTVDQATPFGNSRLHACEYTLTSPDKKFVTTIRACSAHEPAKFHSKYTVSERIDLINKMFVAFHKSKLPDFTHDLQTMPGEILGRPAERVQSTFRHGNDWSVNHSAMVYIDEVRYHIQVTEHGKGTGELLSDEQIGKVFSSFKLLNVTGTRSESDTDNDRATSDNVKIARWPVSAGGNGHFYQAVAVRSEISWDQANAAAEKAGGYLVTITSDAENEFVFKLIDEPQYWNASRTASANVCGPWIGGIQSPGSAEPNGGWTWATGEAFQYANWDSQQPNNYGNGNENRILFGMQKRRVSAWCDVNHDFSETKSFVIEFDAERSSSTKGPVAKDTHPRMSASSTSRPCDISGTWRGGDWGIVKIHKIDDGSFEGVYSDTYGVDVGRISLKQVEEGKLEGTWSEGTYRFGGLTFESLENGLLRGAYTTDPNCEHYPGSPERASVEWTAAHSARKDNDRESATDQKTQGGLTAGNLNGRGTRKRSFGQRAPQSRFSGPGWDEDQRYREYQSRQLRYDHMRRMNNALPGWQPIPRGAMGLRP